MLGQCVKIRPFLHIPSPQILRVLCISSAPLSLLEKKAAVKFQLKFTLDTVSQALLLVFIDQHKMTQGLTLIILIGSTKAVLRNLAQTGILKNLMVQNIICFVVNSFIQ